MAVPTQPGSKTAAVLWTVMPSRAMLLRPSRRPEQIVRQFERLHGGRQREIACLHDERFTLRDDQRAHGLPDREWLPRIDVREAGMLEDHEGVAQAEIDRARSEMLFQVRFRRNLDFPLSQRLENLAVSQYHRITPMHHVTFWPARALLYRETLIT